MALFCSYWCFLACHLPLVQTVSVAAEDFPCPHLLSCRWNMFTLHSSWVPLNFCASSNHRNSVLMGITNTLQWGSNGWWMHILPEMYLLYWCTCSLVLSDSQNTYTKIQFLRISRHSHQSNKSNVGLSQSNSIGHMSLKPALMTSLCVCVHVGV